MTPERLAEIRQSVAKCPGAWDERGRHLMRPREIALQGPVAIGQRRELLEYADVLLSAGEPPA
jgi:hypothetical protein